MVYAQLINDIQKVIHQYTGSYCMNTIQNPVPGKQGSQLTLLITIPCENEINTASMVEEKI